MTSVKHASIDFLTRKRRNYESPKRRRWFKYQLR